MKNAQRIGHTEAVTLFGSGWIICLLRAMIAWYSNWLWAGQSGF